MSRHPPRRSLIRKPAILAVLTLTLLLATEAKAKLTPERIAYWERIHQCEQPGSWSHPEQSEYTGGLGIGRAGWQWWAGELGLLEKYPTAGSAPRLVQIRVASYGWRIHRGLWTSMNVCGYPGRANG